jgi:hypothetical protein
MWRKPLGALFMRQGHGPSTSALSTAGEVDPPSRTTRLEGGVCGQAQAVYRELER